MKRFYLLGAVVGTLLPYAFFVPFVLEHGLHIPLFFSQLFANRIAAFFGMDVIVSAVVLWGFVFAEGHRLAMQRLWVYVVCTLVVGVSLALPLFLYVREDHLAQARASDISAS